MHDVFEALFGTAAWCAAFTSPALVIASLAYAHDRRLCPEAWRRLDLVDLEHLHAASTLPHRRNALPEVGRYYATATEMPREARRTAMRLMLFGALALPGALLGLLGLLAFGWGLTAIPVVVVAIGAFTMGRKLMRADPAFLDGADKLRRHLRRASAWSVFVVGVWACTVPPSVFFFAPVLLAAALCWHCSTRIEGATRQLELALLSRAASATAA